MMTLIIFIYLKDITTSNNRLYTSFKIHYLEITLFEIDFNLNFQ